MMATRFLFGVALWLIWMPEAYTQTAMRWKFEPGKSFECERVVTQKQTVESKGKTFPSNRKSTWVIRLDVLERLADSACIQATLVKVEQSVTPVVAEELLDSKLDQKMQGSTFKLKVLPTGKIVQLDGYEDFLKRATQNDKGKLLALRATMPEEAVRQAFADLFGPLPDHAVRKGDTWQREALEPIPHFGLLRATSHFTYTGARNAIEQMDYSVKTKYELPKDDMSVLFRVTKGDVASEKAFGLLAFDHAAGHLLRHDRRMLLRGELTIEVMERRQKMEFTSDNEVAIRIHATKR